MESIAEAAQALTEALAGFDPGWLLGSEAVELVETLARVEKVCAATRARAAARADECGAYRSMGHRSGAEWLARTMGTSLGQASTAIETAKAIDGLTATKEAFAAGRLSEAQVAEVAKAAAVDPSAEHALLQTAEHGDLRALNYQARRVRLKAEAPEDLHERQHQAREFQHWVDDEGMIAGRFRLPPEIGTPSSTASTPTPTATTSRPGGKAAPGPAPPMLPMPSSNYYRAAGVAARRGPIWWSSSSSTPCSAATRKTANSATYPGSARCRSPWPAASAKTPSLKGVLVDGCQIHKVRHFGRHIPAEVRTALELGPPPNLDGASCVEEGCGRRHGLEWDHLDPLAHHGPTAYHNLKARCRPHHREKTQRDRQAGLIPGRDPP